MDLQLKILYFFQSIRNPILSALFLILTISTEVPVIILFTAIMYWCINKKYGQKLLLSLVGNICINTGIKEYVKAPRPIGVEGIESMRVSTATGYSFPSGHTQTATSFWVSLMVIFRKSWIYVLGIIMILGVGLSRLYLGVHWPIDVLCSWIFGILFTIIFAKIFDYVDESKKYYIFIILLIPFLLLIPIINSLDYIKMLGLFSGFILGYIIEDKFIKFDTNNRNNRRINFSNKKSSKFEDKSKTTINIYRFLIGIVTLGLVYVGLKYLGNLAMDLIILNKENLLIAIVDYIRYTLLLLYAMAGVPALFKIFKLS